MFFFHRRHFCHICRISLCQSWRSHTHTQTDKRLFVVRKNKTSMGILWKTEHVSKCCWPSFSPPPHMFSLVRGAGIRYFSVKLKRRPTCKFIPSTQEPCYAIPRKETPLSLSLSLPLSLPPPPPLPLCNNRSSKVQTSDLSRPVGI